VQLIQLAEQLSSSNVLGIVIPQRLDQRVVPHLVVALEKALDVLRPRDLFLVLVEVAADQHRWDLAVDHDGVERLQPKLQVEQLPEVEP